MWYKKPQQPYSFDLKLNSKIQNEFIEFCNEEIFYSTQNDSADLLSYKLNRNIFALFNFNEIDKSFLLFVLNYFQEKKIEFNNENLISFFSNPSCSPNHVLFVSTSHSYATVKKASQFLDLAQPEKKFLWKEYLADYQVLFADKYFISPEFNNVLDSKKILVNNYLLGLEKIKSQLLEPDSKFLISLPALLRTNLIKEKPIKYKALVEYLFDKGLVSPLMSFEETLGNQTIFEYTALRCQNNTMWWIEKMLIDYEGNFNYSEMIEYFESQIKPGFYLISFKEEFNNYKKMIQFMKKIKIKNCLELSLSEKIILKDKLIKI